MSCAIALAVIDVIEKEGLKDNALQVGKYLLDKFKQLHQNHRLIGDVRYTIYSYCQSVKMFSFLY